MTPWPNCGRPAAGRRLSHYYEQTSDPGCKTAILINGIPASGKSTITRLLAETFSLPVLTIDGIKEPFMARAPVDRPMNRQLGCAAYEVIWSIVGASPASMVWLIDAVRLSAAETLQRLLQQAGVEQVIEVWNHISRSWPSRAMPRGWRRGRRATPEKSICRSWPSWPGGRSPCR